MVFLSLPENPVFTDEGRFGRDASLPASPLLGQLSLHAYNHLSVHHFHTAAALSGVRGRDPAQPNLPDALRRLIYT